MKKLIKMYFALSVYDLDHLDPVSLYIGVILRLSFSCFDRWE